MLVSPVNGIGPEELKVRDLLMRLKDSTVQEIIVATNPNRAALAPAVDVTDGMVCLLCLQHQSANLIEW